MARDEPDEDGAVAGATPMMAQYLSLKRQADGCLLFYRMGDFYELFFDDARIAAACLDIALTARGEHEWEKVPMGGVPVHAADARSEERRGGTECVRPGISWGWPD